MAKNLKQFEERLEKLNLKTVFEDMEHGVYDFTKDGKCSGCGQCCANYLPLSSSEIKEIKRL